MNPPQLEANNPKHPIRRSPASQHQFLGFDPREQPDATQHLSTNTCGVSLGKNLLEIMGKCSEILSSHSPKMASQQKCT